MRRLNMSGSFGCGYRLSAVVNNWPFVSSGVNHLCISADC
jgi:hypothetical protein